MIIMSGRGRWSDMNVTLVNKNERQVEGAGWYNVILVNENEWQVEGAGVV